MGVTYTLHLIEPNKFSRVIKELTPQPLTGTDDVAAYLKSHHVAENATLLHEFADYFTTPGIDRDAYPYNALLTSIVTVKEWRLHKSLSSHGLAKPLSTLPALAPVRFLVTLDGWEVDVPYQLLSESGLYGIWSSTYLKSSCPTVDRFCSRIDAQNYATTVNPPFFDRLLRRPFNADVALASWLKHWDAWQDIREAITTTVDRGWLLGYSLFP